MTKQKSQRNHESVPYFDFKTTCRRCNKRSKRKNQIVCDYCHEHYFKPEPI